MSAEFNRGRQLDVINEDDVLEGPTSAIFVGRDTLFDDAMTELSSIENVRLPLEVTFYGEAGEDLGGPRREFFKLAIGELQERIILDTCLKRSSDFIAHKIYFASGLLVGLSAFQGGPCAAFLDSVVSDTDMQESEEYRQFRSGLKRVGLLQLIESKPTMKYLFRPRINKLTVQRLLTILAPQFSERGSNSRIKEEKAFGSFVKYVRNVAAGRQGSLNLGCVLSFVTGAEEEPVLGFSKDPSTKFTELPGALPTASTCSNELYLPTNIAQDENETFGKYDLAFSNEYFGLL